MDKEKLLHYLNSNVDNDNLTDEQLEGYKICIQDIEELDDVSHTAHWVEHDEGYIDCSHCGCVAPCIELADRFIWKKSKFCPDCGYLMESEDEE